MRQDQDTYTFNCSGQLTSMTDLNGYTTSLTLHERQAHTVTDPAGRSLTLSWTGSNITGDRRERDAEPHRLVHYDGSGNLRT